MVARKVKSSAAAGEPERLSPDQSSSSAICVRDHLRLTRDEGRAKLPIGARNIEPDRWAICALSDW